jgi:hypothetical protein
MYDYWLGGKDHFAVDREAAEQVLAHMPFMRTVALANRQFLASAVRYLASEIGVRQFLDIGSGLPAMDNVHEVAQRAAPESRVVYVDNDPIVLAHARALLTSAPEGRCSYLDADAHDSGRILAEAARTLDFSQPVAVMMLTVLHFIPNDDDPYGLVARYLDAVPPGSYLAISHSSSDTQGDVVSAGTSGYNASSRSPVSPRSLAEVTRFFDGLELVPPGVVPVGQWTPAGVADAPALQGYSGLARKP